MNDDDFMDLLKTNVSTGTTTPREEEGTAGDVSPKTTSPKPIPPDTALLNRGNVVEYILWTKTTYKIYPNGFRTPPHSESWWDKKSGDVFVGKKKEKKQAKIVEVQQEKEECY